MNPKYELGDCFRESEFDTDGYIEIINISPTLGVDRPFNEKLLYYYFLKDVRGDGVTYDCCSEEYLTESCWLIEKDRVIS